MDKEKETKVEVKEEPKKAPKAKPAVDRDAFIKRKLKAINYMDNELLAKRLAAKLRR